MSPQRFEHVIRQDIHNKRIVREVDRTRQREFRRWGVIGVFLVTVLLCSAWLHFEIRQHWYRLQQRQQELVRELEINRHLKLEIETLRAPARIERIAIERLDFVAPGSDDAVVIERVVPAAEPDRSLVATRRGATPYAGRP